MKTRKQAAPKKGSRKQVTQKKTASKGKTQKRTATKRVVRKPVLQTQATQAEATPLTVAPTEVLPTSILPATKTTLAFSYLSLRKTVGMLGTSLPFLVSLGAWILFHQPQQSSISAYYYTGMRNVFVGALCAIGLFLFSYKGYGLADEIAGKLCFVFALGVAFFPTTPTAGSVSDAARVIGIFHLIFAAGFFLTLSYFCLFLFIKTNASGIPPMTRNKIYRNRVYRICGWVMVACIVLLAAYNIFNGDVTPLANLNPIFWLEATAIVAFGVSWLTKGEAILKDEE